MKKYFIQSEKSETLTTRFTVSDFLTTKVRCFANAFPKNGKRYTRAFDDVNN